MIGGRLFSWVLAGVLLGGCASTLPSKSVDPMPLTLCENQQASSSSSQNVHAVFIHRDALFGVNLETQTVQELIPSQGRGSVDYTTVLALFSGDGSGLLVKRDWEGRDSWWSLRSDGSELRRLYLPVVHQIQQVVRLCQTEFIAVLVDGQFARFDLQGEPTFWNPESGDERIPDSQVSISPRHDKVAYPTNLGFVVLVPKENGLAVAHRLPGQKIHGWLGNDRLVTGDAESFYVSDLRAGQTHKVEHKNVLETRSRLISVSPDPKGEVLYVGEDATFSTANEIVVLDSKTLRRLSALPHSPPSAYTGIPQFSPLGTYEVWPVIAPTERPYAEAVIILQVDNGEVVLKTSEDMVSVPYVFHPGDDGFVFTDQSRDGRILVYQNYKGERLDLLHSPESHLFKGFEWNPRLGQAPER